MQLLQGKELLKALLASMVCWLAVWVLLEDFALLLATAVSAITGIAFLLLPGLIEKRGKERKAKKAEKHLAFALLSISSELSYNNNFEQVLKNASIQNHGLFSRELKTALNEVRQSGASMQEALMHFSEKYKSTQLKRALIQLIACFEQGNLKENSEAVKRIALEILARQRIECKEFNSKLAVLSLMFISMSAVLPALFNAFIIVGSTFLELDFTPLQVLLIGAIGFPLLNAGIIYAALESVPEFLKE